MTARDDSGNVFVDFVWGNMPLQPNDDRTGGEIEFGGGAGDKGYAPTYTYGSSTLQTADYNVYISNDEGRTYSVPADSHTIATEGYSNFPGFIPDYAGDGDAGLEVVVPKVVGKTDPEAVAALSAEGFGHTYFQVNPAVTHGVTSSTTVTLTVDQMYNIKKGDTVYVDQLIVGTTPYAIGNVQLTATTANSISFANAGGEYSFDDDATGAVWGSATSTRRVIDQDPAAGAIADEGSDVQLTVLYVD